jgi:hypothetical protein
MDALTQEFIFEADVSKVSGVPASMWGPQLNQVTPEHIASRFSLLALQSSSSSADAAFNTLPVMEEDDIPDLVDPIEEAPVG